eukprot:COSAG02_NODE_118_length_35376_cov_20.294923_9_plen_58_part_00
MDHRDLNSLQPLDEGEVIVSRGNEANQSMASCLVVPGTYAVDRVYCATQNRSQYIAR